MRYLARRIEVGYRRKGAEDGIPSMPALREHRKRSRQDGSWSRLPCVHEGGSWRNGGKIIAGNHEARPNPS